jgi:hypothetical protein
MKVLFTEINLSAEIDMLELARRVLEPRLKFQLPIASGRVWLGATICPFSNTSFRSHTDARRLFKARTAE